MASKQTKGSKPPKIFIDSSVLIAAAISSTGSARDLIMKSFHNKLEVVISDLVIAETQKNLANKAPQALPVLQLFLGALNPEVVSPTKTSVLKASEVVELKDAPIVAGATYSKADYLVTFDRKHLLQHKREIKAILKVKVVTPNELIK